MAERNSGCLFVLLSLPSAFVWALRETVRQEFLPRPRNLHTAQEAMKIADELASERGGSSAAFAYVQRALELEPQNIKAAKFMAGYYTRSGKFSEALPYVVLAAQDSHPDSVYRLLLTETLSALGKHTKVGDAREEQ